MYTSEQLLNTLQRRIRVIHADDHKLIKNALKTILTSETTHIQVVAGVSSYDELFSFLEYDQPDLLILDGLIIGGAPSAYLPILKKKYPDLKILLLWLGADEQSLTKWIHLIDGQLNLNADKEELILAIEKITNGETYFTLPVFKRHKNE